MILLVFLLLRLRRFSILSSSAIKHFSLFLIFRGLLNNIEHLARSLGDIVYLFNLSPQYLQNSFFIDFSASLSAVFLFLNFIVCFGIFIPPYQMALELPSCFSILITLFTKLSIFGS